MPAWLEQKIGPVPLVPAVAFVIGCALSAGLSFLFAQEARELLALRFQNTSDQIADLVQGRMRLYTDVLYGAQGLFAASQAVESDEWDAYVAGLHIAQNYQSIASMLYMPRVPAAATSSYPYAIFPYTPKDEYFPITYAVQTVISTSSAKGFDVSSEQKRAAALTAAADWNTPRATAVVPAATSNIPVFSIYAPIYAHGALIETTDQRERALRGYVGAAFRVKKLFSGLNEDPIFDRNIDAEIYDASDQSNASLDTLLFDTANDRLAPLAPSGGLTRWVSIPVAGRIWTIRFSALPGYGRGAMADMLPWLVLAVGLLVSFFLASILYGLTNPRTRRMIVRAVDSRSARHK